MLYANHEEQQYKGACGGAVMHKAPLMVRNRKIFTHVVSNDITDMALQKFAHCWENRYWTVSSYHPLRRVVLGNGDYSSKFPFGWYYTCHQR